MSLKVIHFQSIFLIDFYLKKRLIYVQKCEITHQTALSRKFERKRILQYQEQKLAEKELND